jgi:hypothetical protein
MPFPTHIPTFLIASFSSRHSHPRTGQPRFGTQFLWQRNSPASRPGILCRRFAPGNEIPRAFSPIGIQDKLSRLLVALNYFQLYQFFPLIEFHGQGGGNIVNSPEMTNALSLLFGAEGGNQIRTLLQERLNFGDRQP